MLYPIYKSAFFLGKALPIKLSYRIASAVAYFYFIFTKKDKEAIRSNLRIILGKDVPMRDIDIHAAGVFKNFAKYLSDFFRSLRPDNNFLKEKIEFINLSYLDECLMDKKGVILVSCHLGNWELGAAVVASLGHPISAIVLEHNDRRINSLFSGERRGNNIKAIPLGAGIRQCFNVLRMNEILAIAADKDYSGSTEEVTFFGRKTMMPRGAAVLSLKTGSPIIPCYFIRKEDDTFIFKFEKPIRYKPTGDKSKDVIGLMETYLALFEKNIKEFPDQWYVFDNVWKQT